MYKPASYVVIDVETRNLTPEMVEFEGQFLKAHAGTKDEGKKEEQIRKKKDALLTRGALADSAEMAVIGFYIQGMQPVLLHTLDFTGQIDGVECQKFTSIYHLLPVFGEYLDVLCDETTEIVVARAGFDLPKLRFAFARHRVKMPKILAPKSNNSVFDVLHVFGRYFMVSSAAEYQVGLDEVTIRLGIEGGAKIITGADVPRMIDEGKHEEVLVYNSIDVMKTLQAYLVLTGQ